MKHYIGIAGTNRQGSTNRRLLQFIKEHFADKAEIELMDIGGLPVFYKTPDRSVPERVTEMAKKIEASDGVIISTPEYDHGVPAVLMNALEWLSYGVHPFADKPVMITGASYGMLDFPGPTDATPDAGLPGTVRPDHAIIRIHGGPLLTSL